MSDIESAVAPLRFLIVEDHALLNEALSLALRLEGFDDIEALRARILADMGAYL